MSNLSNSPKRNSDEDLKNQKDWESLLQKTIMSIIIGSNVQGDVIFYHCSKDSYSKESFNTNFNII